MRNDYGFCCVAILVLLYLAINVADAYWLYFYVKAIVDPLPRNAVNRTSSGWTGYTTMMFFFGLPWGVVNMWVSLAALGAVSSAGKDKSKLTQWLLALFAVFVVVPAGLFITILPFFGGWIITPIVQSWTWNHRCDGYPMYAILDAKAYNGPSYQKNVAYFYINGNDDLQFTYEISNPGDDDQWFFRLRQWNMDQLTIPIDNYPTLQSVGYNFVDNTLTGNCTVPSTPSMFNGSTSTRTCVSGTFDQAWDLSFNITSTVPLNNTLDANAVQPSSTVLGIRDAPWYVENSPPAAILREADKVTGMLDAIVLRTAVVRPHDCTELKVCIAGVQGREGSQVMAEVLAPLGVILMRQSDYAVECTTPSDP